MTSTDMNDLKSAFATDSDKKVVQHQSEDPEETITE
jgi:hypothetical protein